MVLRFNSFLLNSSSTHSTTIFLLALFFCFQVAVTSTCPHVMNDQIQQCVQPVAEYAKVLNQQQDASSQSSQSSGLGQAIQIGLPKIGGQVFRELCRLIRDFENCVEGFREKCHKHITINLISSSYGFLCNEGYSTFMKSADCLMELDQRPSVKKCHDNTLKEIEKANNEILISMPIKLERMCDALNSFSDCVMTPISQNCGVEAWKVIFQVLKDTTKTLMPACHFPEEAFPVSVTPTEEVIIKSSKWLTSKTNKARIDGSSSRHREGGSAKTNTKSGKQRQKNSHTTPDYVIEDQQFEDRRKFAQNQISQENTRRHQKEPSSANKTFCHHFRSLILTILLALLTNL